MTRPCSSNRVSRRHLPYARLCSARADRQFPIWVGHWSNWEKINELERVGLMMSGQMTAGSWIYIGSQGIVQGTFETFSARRRKALWW